MVYDWDYAFACAPGAFAIFAVLEFVARSIASRCLSARVLVRAGQLFLLLCFLISGCIQPLGSSRSAHVLWMLAVPGFLAIAGVFMRMVMGSDNV